MTHPKERLPSCFKPASPSSQPQGNPTATGSKHHTHRGDEAAAPFLQGMHTFKSGQWDTCRACSRWTTGRWHPLAVKHTTPMVGAGLTLSCLKSPNPRILPQEIQQHSSASFYCKNWDQSHQPLHPGKLQEFSWPWIKCRLKINLCFLV